MLVAPNGSRNIGFGQGMDTVQIASQVVNTLKANRGAVNSNVYVNRSISRVSIGGDVVNSNVLAGYNQNFGTITSTVLGIASSELSSSARAAPRADPRAARRGNVGANRRIGAELGLRGLDPAEQCQRLRRSERDVPDRRPYQRQDRRYDQQQHRDAEIADSSILLGPHATVHRPRRPAEYPPTALHTYGSDSNAGRQEPQRPNPLSARPHRKRRPRNRPSRNEPQVSFAGRSVHATLRFSARFTLSSGESRARRCRGDTSPR